LNSSNWTSDVESEQGDALLRYCASEPPSIQYPCSSKARITPSFVCSSSCSLKRTSWFTSGSSLILSSIVKSSLSRVGSKVLDGHVCKPFGIVGQFVLVGPSGRF